MNLYSSEENTMSAGTGGAMGWNDRERNYKVRINTRF
jgi:hypothetical protein